MRRRSFLGGVATTPALAVAIAAGAHATAQSEDTDPLVRLYAEWREAVDELDDTDVDGEEASDLMKKIADLAMTIANTKAKSAAGQIAQIEWLRDDLGGYISDVTGGAYIGIFDIMIAGVKGRAS